MLDSLVKNSGKDDFKYLNEEFDNNVLNLFKIKVFYPHEYMSDFWRLEEELPSKEKFYSSLTVKNISDKEYEHVLKVWNTFQIKTMKDYHSLYIKCDVLFLAVVFRNNNLKNYGLWIK